MNTVSRCNNLNMTNGVCAIAIRSFITHISLTY